MPKWEDIVAIVEQLFSSTVGKWVLGFIAAVILLWLVSFLVGQIIEIWGSKIVPIFYKRDEKRRNLRRQRFAEHIESEMRAINRQENWSDYRFAELEAEVEAEGARRAWLPFLRVGQGELRREKSLSAALRRSRERLILLEGEPGSGKSVALRHVTTHLAQKGMRARSNRAVIPIYVNLKGLIRPPETPIDRNLIEAFILESLNRVNDRDIDQFLADEFRRGLEEGTWFFLLDSFDEIPEVLASKDADAVIRAYAQAIADFLGGLNRCRGVVASRYFRGPGQVDWPRFRILNLSVERQHQLVRRANLKSSEEGSIIGQLGIAPTEIQKMAGNPLFLNLVMEHALAGHPFPETTHRVFETYVCGRFERDQERMQKRFRLDVDAVRRVAEQIAFCMAADPGLGLSPTRAALATALERLGFDPHVDLHTALDALEYVKLARSDTPTVAGPERLFTFAHRRFQEYFATQVVLQEPERVSPLELLTNAHWRETAVVICQTQEGEQLAPIFAQARALINAHHQSIAAALADLRDEQGNWIEEKLPVSFPWPNGLLHLLGLLQDGFGVRRSLVPEQIRVQIGEIVLWATQTGILPDRKWALEVAGIAPTQNYLLEMVRQAIQSSSKILHDIAYQQLARLDYIPEDISQWIRRSLVRLNAGYHLVRNRFTTYAQLERLPNRKILISTTRGLIIATFVDLGLLIPAGLILLLSEKTSKPWTLVIASTSTTTHPFQIVLPISLMVLISILATHLIMLTLSHSQNLFMKAYILGIRTLTLGLVFLLIFLNSIWLAVFWGIVTYAFLVTCSIITSLDLLNKPPSLAWLLAPLYTLSEDLKSIGKKAKSLPTKKTAVTIATRIVLMIVVLLMMILGLIFLTTYIPSDTATWIIIAIMVLAAMIPGGRLSILDLPKLRRWWRNSGQFLQPDLFLEYMAALKSPVLYANFLKYARLREQIIASLETLDLLKLMLQVWERQFRQEKNSAPEIIIYELGIENLGIYKPKSYIPIIQTEKKFLERYSPWLGIVLSHNISEETLDQLHLLIEWVRSRLPEDA